MKFTIHAMQRSQQRGFSRENHELIERYGLTHSAPGNAEKLRLSKKDSEFNLYDLKEQIVHLKSSNDLSKKKELKNLHKLLQSYNNTAKREFVIDPLEDVVITMGIIKKKY